MHEMLFLGTIVALYMPHLLSPGPNFLVLTRVAASESRLHGVVTSIGITSASTLYATLAVAGVGALLAHSPNVRLALQVAGGAYLLYKGVTLVRRAAPLHAAAASGSARQSLAQAYFNGLATNLTNPQAVMFFSSVFAALLSPDLAPWAGPAGVATVAITSLSVNLATVMLFSLASVQQRYMLAKTWIDRGAGVLLGGFGIRLLGVMWR
jgi:threonine/homoserine/homoserine lactone efflux protein